MSKQRIIPNSTLVRDAIEMGCASRPPADDQPQPGDLPGWSDARRATNKERPIPMSLKRWAVEAVSALGEVSPTTPDDLGLIVKTLIDTIREAEQNNAD